MKKIALFYLILSLSQSIIGQINPILMRTSLTGFVNVEINPLDALMNFDAKPEKNDSSKIAVIKEFKAPINKDTIFSNVHSFFYEQYPWYSTQVYTAQAGHSTWHFPETIERKLTVINAKNIELSDFYWSGIGGHRMQFFHHLKLKYNRHGRLIKINETHEIPPNKKRKSTWRYKYRDGKLTSLSAEGTKLKNQYDKSGKLVSTMVYSGNGRMNYPYLNADSLEAFKMRKVSTYKIREQLDNHNLEIYQLVYYSYSGDKLTKMVSYDSQSGVQKTTIHYDAMERISAVEEEHVMGGLKLAYTYEKNSNRLLERNERWIKDCLLRGCSEIEIIETYEYNSEGLISKIDYSSYEHYSDRSRKMDIDFVRGKLIQYQ